MMMSIPLTPIKLVPKKPTEGYDSQIDLSDVLIQHLCIDPNKSLRVSFGKKIKTVNVRTVNIASDEIHLPESVMESLSLPIKTYKFQAKIDNQTLFMGPVVALLTNMKTKKPNFQSISAFCEELNQRISDVGGFFYVFSFHDFSKEETHGFYFEDGKWTFSKLPLPDVIYNRIHSRKVEQLKSFKSFRRSLEQLSIPFFNDRFLSKWEVYQHLILENQLHPYIPETRILSLENFNDLFEKYDTLFIKPVHGSQGKNIMKIIKKENQLLLQTSQNPGSEITIEKSSAGKIFQQLKPLLQNRIYIIQQGISLIEFQSHALDFRVLVHKRELNSWEVTSIVARISAEQQFVSNLAKGGKIMKPQHVLNVCFGKHMTSGLISIMKELSIEAASIISRHSSGIIGELGVDVGIDSAGKCWIIEINSKPSKNFEDNTTKVRPSAKAIIQFCTKLAFDWALEKEE
jgi:hypothetical protein